MEAGLHSCYRPLSLRRARLRLRGPSTGQESTTSREEIGMLVAKVIAFIGLVLFIIQLARPTGQQAA